MRSEIFLDNTNKAVTDKLDNKKIIVSATAFIVYHLCQKTVLGVITAFSGH